MKRNIRNEYSVYKHLNAEQRDLIANHYSEGKKQYEIAKIVGVHPSTISRELKRNSKRRFPLDYFPIYAQTLAGKRKIESRQKERIQNSKVRELISKKIRDDWTPEQIAGYINSTQKGLHTNHESIYLYIYNDARELIPYLARSHKKRHNRQQKHGKRMHKIPNRTMIDQRPGVINNKKRYGDWEADTVVSRQSKASLVVIRERKSQQIRIRKINSRTADKTRKAIISMMNHIPNNLKLSITFDNGLENAQHEIVAKTLGLKTYFCNPYHSWEKGGIENGNGLIRRYLPKKTDFSLIPDSEIKYIENQLNNRPRKSLGFKTPNQVFLNCTK